jgi:hypothetical protein
LCSAFQAGVAVISGICSTAVMVSTLVRLTRAAMKAR